MDHGKTNKGTINNMNPGAYSQKQKLKKSVKLELKCDDGTTTRMYASGNCAVENDK